MSNLLEKQSSKRLFKKHNYKNPEKIKDFIINLKLIEGAIKYFRTLYKQNKSAIDEEEFFDLTNMNQKTKQQIFAYSKLNPPYNNLTKK